MAPSLLSVFLPIKAKYDVFASNNRYFDGEAPRKLVLIEGGHQVHIASGLDSLSCKAEEWTSVRVDSVG